MTPDEIAKLTANARHAGNHVKDCGHGTLLHTLANACDAAMHERGDAQDIIGQLVAALEAARHGLVVSNNLRATDQAEEIIEVHLSNGMPRGALEWMTDNSKEIAIVDAALATAHAAQDAPARSIERTPNGNASAKWPDYSETYVWPPGSPCPKDVPAVEPPALPLMRDTCQGNAMHKADCDRVRSHFASAYMANTTPLKNQLTPGLLADLAALESKWRCASKFEENSIITRLAIKVCADELSALIKKGDT